MSPKNENKRLSKNSNQKTQSTLSVINDLTPPWRCQCGDCPVPAKMLANINNIIGFIPKDMILAGDCSQIAMQLDEFRKAGCKGFGKLMFRFDGYEQDSREPFEIPEIRTYIQKICSFYPELFLYIKEEQLNYILVCLFDFDIKRTDEKTKVIIPDTEENNAKMAEIDTANKHYKEHMCKTFCCFYREATMKYHSTSCRSLQ